jgi:hypothetical protein
MINKKKGKERLSKTKFLKTYGVVSIILTAATKRDFTETLTKNVVCSKSSHQFLRSNFKNSNLGFVCSHHF